MNELKKINNSIFSYDQSLYPKLQNLQDQNERENKSTFEGFTDTDMLYWFIYKRKNIDVKKETSDRTKYEYNRELKQFIMNVIEHAAVIDLDIQMDETDSLLKNIEARHLRKYQEWLVNDSPHVLNKKPYSPASITRKTTIIKAFFDYLYVNNYTRHNASNGLKTAGVSADERPNRDLGPSEVTKILNAVEQVDIRYYAIILTLVTTGLRNEELCNLKIASVKTDYVNGGLYFEVIGKGNKKRDVPIKNSVLRVISLYRRSYGLSDLEAGQEDEAIFVTSSGSKYSPSYLSQALKKVIAKSMNGQLEKAVTAHSFRHAYAIISHINNVNIYDIMRSLGHEKIDTTMIYLEKVTARSKNAMHSWDENILGKHFN